MSTPKANSMDVEPTMTASGTDVPRAAIVNDSPSLASPASSPLSDALNPPYKLVEFRRSTRSTAPLVVLSAVPLNQGIVQSAPLLSAGSTEPDISEPAKSSAPPTAKQKAPSPAKRRPRKSTTVVPQPSTRVSR
ncbi:hypothetical protein FIBSPDRAFT_950017 [Athelia psychrophila]|uniref:Uncharacterized protein n=1 Tax=Athelia psychrophila TaxID=1759441 RepID=A0A166P1H3_9AGAM|nr:hypothetical protein FIBSPDRAFT_950017 [Fibularhizoctonia sp. CBS 109695]